MIEITIHRAGTAERILSFDQETIRIGRVSGNDLVLEGKDCSRHHAEIRREGGQYRIVDLDSTNGVCLDGERLPELVLFDGARILIGDSLLTFAIQGEDGAFNQEDLATAISNPAPAPPSAGPIDAANETCFLVIRRGKKAQNFKIAPGVDYIIGRSPEADVQLNDKKSSLRHAQISSRGGAFFLRDLGSSNGTFVNGQRIEEAEVRNGDTFTVGATPITISSEPFDLRDDAVLMDKTYIGGRAALDQATDGSLPVDPGATAATQPLSSGFEEPAGLPTATKIALLAAGLIVVVGAIWFLRRSASERPVSEQATSVAETGGLRVAVRAVERKTLVDVIAASGNIKPLDSASVSAEVDGRLLALNVSVGSLVARGDILAQINPTDIKLQIEEARSSISEEQLTLAREDHERKQKLFDEGVVSRSALDLSKNNYLTLSSAFQSSRARIRQLEEQLSKTSIRAPLAGVVVRTFANEGELIGPGTPLVEIENQSAVLAVLEVPDRDIVRVSLGLPVRATLGAFPGRVFEGQVHTVGSTADPTSKAFTIEALIDNTDESLRSGMIAEVEILFSSRDGLAASAEALIDQRDNQATVLVVEDGVVRRQRVTVGLSVDREVEVLEGLEEGALLVVTGQQRLADGDVVSAYEEARNGTR
jgi:membrane fusion protein (multidrug efflux system)